MSRYRRPLPNGRRQSIRKQGTHMHRQAMGRDAAGRFLPRLRPKGRRRRTT